MGKQNREKKVEVRQSLTFGGMLPERHCRKPLPNLSRYPSGKPKISNILEIIWHPLNPLFGRHLHNFQSQQYSEIVWHILESPTITFHSRLTCFEKLRFFNDGCNFWKEHLKHWRSILEFRAVGDESQCGRSKKRLRISENKKAALFSLASKILAYNVGGRGSSRTASSSGYSVAWHSRPWRRRVRSPQPGFTCELRVLWRR